MDLPHDIIERSIISDSGNTVDTYFTIGLLRPDRTYNFPNSTIITMPDEYFIRTQVIYPMAINFTTGNYSNVRNPITNKLIIRPSSFSLRTYLHLSYKGWLFFKGVIRKRFEDFKADPAKNKLVVKENIQWAELEDYVMLELTRLTKVRRRYYINYYKKAAIIDAELQLSKVTVNTMIDDLGLKLKKL
jgi:hypothetical protein